MIAFAALAMFFVLLPAFGVGGVLGVPLLLVATGALVKPSSVVPEGGGVFSRNKR